MDLNFLLAQRLRARDTKALDYLYDHYAEALYGIISRTLHNDGAAEETLQDVFIKIWKHIDQYDPQKGTLFTWMYRIARNQAIDKRRSKDFKSATKSDSLDNYVDLFQADVATADYIGLQEVLNGLGDLCKKLIQMNFFMGYSHAEISKKEKFPLGTVKTKLRACLKKVRTELEADFGKD